MEYKKEIYVDDQSHLPNQYRFKACPKISFDRIVCLIQNGPSKRLEEILHQLKCKTQDKNFEFQPDFETSQLPQLFMTFLLSPTSEYLQITLQIICNFADLHTELYILHLINNGLLPTLDLLLSKTNSANIVLTTICIFQKIVIRSNEWRNSFFQSVNLNNFFQLALQSSIQGCTQSKIVSEVCNFFRASLKYPLTNEFDNFFPLFEELFRKYHQTESIKQILLLYIKLTSIHSFVEYYKDKLYSDSNTKSLINEIIDLSNEKGDEIIIFSLTFALLMLQNYFPINIDNANRFIELLGSCSDEVAYRASLLINHIIKEESALIQKEEYPIICEKLIKGMQDGDLRKIECFLKTFSAFLFKFLDEDSLEICLQHNIGSILGNFMNSESDDIIFLALDEIIMLTEKELTINHEKSILYNFLDNSGEENIQEYLTNAENSDEDVLAKINTISTEYGIDF